MKSVSAFTGLVEFGPRFRSNPAISHVLFDFDGTLSLIREGWVQVMVPMFVEMLPPLPGETEEERRRICQEDILGLNGKQTIYQMMRLAARISERGGRAQEPLYYKHEYLRRLEDRVVPRVAALRAGKAFPDDYLVYGSRQLLDTLSHRGFVLYLASGTDERYVKEEAQLLGLSHYFGNHIYGALDDYKKFSKKMVIERILKENAIPGGRLLSFGDGYVEIQNTKEAGGTAVAVASNEAHNGSGLFDEWKRNRLLGVGADVVVPDYRDAEALINLILES